MCGIAGFYSKKQVSDSRIQKTLNLMKNRGPDNQDSRIFVIKSGSNSVGLLHSRLSIIDLDPRSNQPFSIGTQTIVFNGEIYNHLELRKDLEKQGIELVTKSDTEVLLHFFRIHGEKCVNFFEGMWAFAIYDTDSEALFLSRDRFAEKPLYYYKNHRGFYFGSEVKFLRSLVGKNFSINHRHLMRHLAHGYKSLNKTEETYFEDIRELKYAQNLSVNSMGTGTPERYWSPKCNINQNMSLHDAVNGTREALFNSIKIRLRSDVPLAFCLSGGVDSAAIASIAAKEFGAKVTTFSIIDSDERYNEENNIMATVNDIGCEHHLLAVEQKNPLERLTNLIKYHDAPVATISYYVHSMIPEMLNNGGFKVSFSGTSADELFSGYYDHFILHLNEMKSTPHFSSSLRDWSENIGKFIQNPYFKNPDLYQNNPNFRDHIFDASEKLNTFFIEPFKENFIEENFTNNLFRNRMLNELFHEVTPTVLHEDDLNSMLYSVENRSPFLDEKLQEFAYSIPSRHLIKDGFGKYVLREALKGTLNDTVRLDRRKKGFNASINSMLNFQDPETRESLLDSKSEIFSIIDKTKIENLLAAPTQPNHFSKFIFNFLNAKIFLELN